MPSRRRSSSSGCRRSAPRPPGERPCRLGSHAHDPRSRLREELVAAASCPFRHADMIRAASSAVQRSGVTTITAPETREDTVATRPRPAPRSTRTTISTSTGCSTTRSVRSATPCASSCASASCPTSGDWFEQGILPRELFGELARLGLLGMHLEGYGLPGASSVAYGIVCRELEAGDAGVRSAVSVQGSLAMYAIWRWGIGGAEGALAAGDARRRGDRLLRPHGAGRRLRPGLDADARTPRRLGLGAERGEDVDHERDDRRRRGRVGADGRRRRSAASSSRRARRASRRRRSTRRSRCARR